MEKRKTYGLPRGCDWDNDMPEPTVETRFSRYDPKYRAFAILRVVMGIISLFLNARMFYVAIPAIKEALELNGIQPIR